MDETTVALVADAARAQLFLVEAATGKWTPLEAITHPEGRMHDRDLEEKRWVPNAGSRHGPDREDHPHGRHELEAERFARFVAAELARHYDDRTFRRLVLVAPAEFMGLLRRQLSPRVAGSIIEELTRDLSKERADALEDQVPIPHH